MMMMAVIVVVLVRPMLDLAPARQHEDMPAGVHHVDVGAVEPRQHRRGDDLVDGAKHGLAVAEIEHAVERADELVELVRAEQNRDAALAADAAHHVDRHLLVSRVEADQRLVEQQQLRLPNQRLRQQ